MTDIEIKQARELVDQLYERTREIEYMVDNDMENLPTSGELQEFLCLVTRVTMFIEDLAYE